MTSKYLSSTENTKGGKGRQSSPKKSQEHSPTAANNKDEKNNESPISPFELSVGFPPREECRVLIIGCGNSRLGEQMLEDGWGGGITNVDFSSVLISQMREKYSDNFYEALQIRHDRERRLGEKEVNSLKKGNHAGGSVTMSQNPKVDKGANENQTPMIKMLWECCDVTCSLPFPDGAFDLIMCKGTLDAILCSTGSIANARSMVEECSRVLDNRGVMFVVSHGNPDNRLRYFENDGNSSFFSH